MPRRTSLGWETKESADRKETAAFSLPDMRFFFAISILLAVRVAACPSVLFKTAPSASLSPSVITQLNLVRQADGSYTSFEIANGAPFSVLSVTPNFEKQFTSCLPAKKAAKNPVPPAPANPAGSPAQFQAAATLSSGNFLVVTEGIASVFDAQMNLLSSAKYTGGDAFVALAELNGDGNPDIVSIVNGGESSAGQLAILLGDGGSSFRSAIVYSIPASWCCRRRGSWRIRCTSRFNEA